MSERLELFLAASRRASDVTSRFKRTVATLYEAHRQAKNDEERWSIGYTSGNLLGTILFEAETLVATLNTDEDEELEDLERYARALYQAIRTKRVAEKLSNVEGRTPEEAAAFAAKAAELRG